MLGISLGLHKTWGQCHPRFTEVEASIAATLRFPSGGIAQIIASFGGTAVDGYRVTGAEAEIELDPAFQFETAAHLRLRKNGVPEETAFPQVDHFGGQAAYFSDCILTGTPPEADRDEGFADMRVLLAIEDAAKPGFPAPIKSPPRPRHPTPDMVRTHPVTTKRLLVEQVFTSREPKNPAMRLWAFACRQRLH